MVIELLLHYKKVHHGHYVYTSWKNSSSKESLPLHLCLVNEAHVKGSHELINYVSTLSLLSLKMNTHTTQVRTLDEKKKRTRTTALQIVHLQTLFTETTLPTLTQRQTLGLRIGMSPRAVQVWFQNKRQLLKKSRVRGVSPVSETSSSSSSSSSERKHRMDIDFLCEMPMSPKSETEEVAESLLWLATI